MRNNLNNLNKDNFKELSADRADDIRARILSSSEQPQKRVLPLALFRKFAVAAVCMALVFGISAVIGLSGRNNPGTTTTDPTASDTTVPPSPTPTQKANSLFGKTFPSQLSVYTNEADFSRDSSLMQQLKMLCGMENAVPSEEDPTCLVYENDIATLTVYNNGEISYKAKILQKSPPANYALQTTKDLLRLPLNEALQIINDFLENFDFSPLQLYFDEEASGFSAYSDELIFKRMLDEILILRNPHIRVRIDTTRRLHFVSGKYSEYFLHKTMSAINVNDAYEQACLSVDPDMCNSVFTDVDLLYDEESYKLDGKEICVPVYSFTGIVTDENGVFSHYTGVLIPAVDIKAL